MAEATEIELRTYVKPDNISDEDFEKQKQLVRELCYRIQVVVGGRDGEQIIQSGETIFHSQNLPGHISYIFMTSGGLVGRGSSRGEAARDLMRQA